ncbi:MAG: segregation/condensation protein A [Pseudomonadota bacterium]
MDLATSEQGGQHQVHLENHEGPLDLLLHLVRRGNMDILDVPIARLCADYFGYLKFMEEVNIGTAGTFTLMAASLVHIKSRALLPKAGAGEEGGAEKDPRAEIVQPLIEYMKVKDTAAMLYQRELLDRDVFLRGGGAEEAEGEEIELRGVSVFDLLDAFRSLIESRRDEPMVIEVDTDSIEERQSRLSRLLAGTGGMPFAAMFPPGAGRREIVVTFMALLEMVKTGLVRLIQDEAGSITVLPPLAGVA